MNIRKLQSGNYQIRQMIDGRTYSVTVPYKPTKKEAYQLITEKAKGGFSGDMTFKKASEEYIAGKKSVLSPSTVRGYNTILRSLPESFTGLPLGAVTAWDVQKVVDKFADKSPKTVRNVHGFISAILGTFRPDLKLSTTLPQKAPKEAYIPSNADISRILEAVKGTRYEVPFRLACYGLRRSEICALTPDDLSDDNYLSITKAKVKADKEWVIKGTKTTASTRTVLIDAELAALIRSTGTVFEVNPNMLYLELTRQQDLLGIPHFSFHKLRHYFASKAHALGMPDAVIMDMGGWKTDHTMKQIYRHAQAEQLLEAQQQYSKNFLDEFGTGFSEVQ